MLPGGGRGQGWADPPEPDRNPARHGGEREEVSTVKAFQGGGGSHTVLWANRVKRPGGMHRDPQSVGPGVRREFLDRYFDLRDLALRLGGEPATSEHNRRSHGHLDTYRADREARNFFGGNPHAFGTAS